MVSVYGLPFSDVRNKTPEKSLAITTNAILELMLEFYLQVFSDTQF